MAWLVTVWTISVAAMVSAAQVSSPPASQTVDPVADATDTARVNAAVNDDVAARTASMRRSQADHARAQAAFVQAQAAYEEAKRRNDAERAEAATAAAAYQHDLATWKTRVAEVDSHNARLRSGSAKASGDQPAAPRPATQVCTMETSTGSNVPRRTCRMVGANARR